MHEETVIQLAKTLFYEKALAKIDGEYVGALAAIPGKAISSDLNYSEIFIRDNVPVMIYLLIEGKYEIVRRFLETCLRLQSEQFQTRGIFPTSFVDAEGGLVADYGQRAIGRVCSVDASLWWMILAHIYVQRTNDLQWATLPEVQLGIQSFLNLILHPSFRDAPTLFVPDGAFMIDRPLDVWGNPLEIQVLLYGALLSAAGLLKLDLAAKGYLNQQNQVLRPHPNDTAAELQIYQLEYAIAWLVRLRCYLLKHYWVNAKGIQMLRRRPTEQYGDEVMNEYNIQTETIPHWLQDWLGDRGGYLIGNIRTGRPDFRFFTLGNCLGAIFDAISPNQQRSLFSLVLHNRNSLFGQMPLRICHPPLDDGDWRKKTGYDRKNLPWCYHNAGHWPSLPWFLVVATLRHKLHYNQTPADSASINVLLQDTYEVMLKRLPQQKWAEYFDGPTGVWIGQQARLYQTWTIVGFLLVHHFLKVNPDDANIMDLPSLKSLCSVKFLSYEQELARNSYVI
jgi:Alkaline and neutral invertase